MEALYTYLPTNNSDSLFLWIGIILSIIAFVASFFFLRKKAKGREHTKNALIAMLFFFMGLIGFTTAFFSGWSMKKIGQVVIYENSLNIGSQNIEYNTIRKIYVREEKSGSFLDPSINAKHDFFLVIECDDNKIHVIPAESYPIGEIKTQIEALR